MSPYITCMLAIFVGCLSGNSAAPGPSTAATVTTAASTIPSAASTAAGPSTPASPTTAAPAANGKPEEEHPVEVIGEFENSLTAKQEKKYKVQRSAASGKHTVLITDKEANMVVTFTLCVRGDHDSEKVVFAVNNIVYSNDGSADTIVVNIDNKELGTATTVAECSGGTGWNMFKGTGPIGKPTPLAAGNHTLTVFAITDKLGIELDYIDAMAYHQNSNVNILCSATFG